MALSRDISEIFNVENVVTLKSGSMLLKVIGTDMYRSATYDFLLLFYRNFVPKIFDKICP